MSYREVPRKIIVVAFNAQVFGMDTATGTRLWSHKGNAFNTAARTVVHGERVFVVGMHEDDLICFHLERGTELWRRPCQTSGMSMMVVDGRLFLASAGQVECFSLDGELLWFDGFKGCGMGPVSLAVDGQSVQPDT